MLDEEKNQVTPDTDPKAEDISNEESKQAETIIDAEIVEPEQPAEENKASGELSSVYSEAGPNEDNQTYFSNYAQPPKKKRKQTKLIVFGAIAGFIVLTVWVSMFALFVPAIGQYLKGNGLDINLPKMEEKVKEQIKIIDIPKGEEPAPKAGEPLTVKQIAKKVTPSVVGIVSKVTNGFSEGEAVGSGIIMSKDGYVLTNNHVVEGVNDITVVLYDGKKYAAMVVGKDKKTDLAVLKIQANDLAAAEFGNSDQLETGDIAVAIGSPSGIQLQNTVTSGIISAINRDIVIEDTPMTLIQTDASINPGNSGGPLVNQFGQVIGINTVKIGISYYEGLGFAIPMNTAKPIIDELISFGYIKGRPSIGINGTAIGQREADVYGVVVGIYIDYVHPSSDAAKKGLARGDIITKINGKDVTSIEDIKKLRDEYVAGDVIKIQVWRNGKTFDLSVKLMDENYLAKITEQT